MCTCACVCVCVCDDSKLNRVIDSPPAVLCDKGRSISMRCTQFGEAERALLTGPARIREPDCDGMQWRWGVSWAVPQRSGPVTLPMGGGRAVSAIAVTWRLEANELVCVWLNREINLT